jgi:tRNA-specific 2-thiouridylase
MEIKTKPNVAGDVVNVMPSPPARVMIAVSGGIDSSVAATLLHGAGYQVTAVLARLTPCVSAVEAEVLTAEASARQLCAQLGIPFHALDLRDIFREQVIDYFVREYARGRTPNPCLMCNRHIKFGQLWTWAQDHGFDYMATGHYARRDQQGKAYQLLRGLDQRKDQSYFLYALDQGSLAHVCFPLGTWDKADVIARAEALDLPATQRPESQEICFIPDNDYRSFLAQYRPQVVEPGPIYDTAGQRLGEHKGIAFYTIGQRRGLGISAPEPLYVIDMNPEENSLIVGPLAELGRKHLLADRAHFISGVWPQESLTVSAQIRYRALPAAAQVEPLNDGQVAVHFREAQRDITPGQAVVFYQNDVVLGGGIITTSY